MDSACLWDMTPLGSPTSARAISCVKSALATASHFSLTVVYIGSWLCKISASVLWGVVRGVHGKRVQTSAKMGGLEEVKS